MEEDKKPVNDGSVGRICHQTQPYWLHDQSEFVRKYSSSADISHFTDREYNPSYPELPADDPRASEDCLLLDVVVSKKTWDDLQADKGYPGMMQANRPDLS